MSGDPREKELIEALRYPTSIIRSEIDFSNCRNKGGFQREDEECITCYSTPECEWLIRHDTPDSSAEHNITQLIAALQFAADYMHAHLTLKHHAPNECPCEGCRWWRDSQEILQKPNPTAA